MIKTEKTTVSTCSLINILSELRTLNILLIFDKIFSKTSTRSIFVMFFQHYSNKESTKKFSLFSEKLVDFSGATNTTSSSELFSNKSSYQSLP